VVHVSLAQLVAEIGLVRDAAQTGERQYDA
jgi:hypothetical protein